MGIYMKYEDVVGDATQIVPWAGAPTPEVKDQPDLPFNSGWVPLDSFKWDVTSAITTKSGQGTSHAKGPKNPKVNDITVTKQVDRSSGYLLETLVSQGEQGKDCLIVFVRTGNPGEIYLQYELKHTLITKLDWNHAKEAIIETVTLSFSDLLMTVWRLDEANDRVETPDGKTTERTRAIKGAPKRVEVHKGKEGTAGSPGFGGPHPGPQGAPGHSGHSR